MDIFGKSTIVLYKNWHWFIRRKLKVKTKKKKRGLIAPSQALPKTNFFETNLTNCNKESIENVL